MLTIHRSPAAPRRFVRLAEDVDGHHDPQRRQKLREEDRA
jgi:hypothetical protein